MELSKVYTILVVHKSAERLDQLHCILQRAGYDVLKAVNSEAACKLAFTQHPDLILIEETDTDSDQALVLRLREIDATTPIPILLTTSAPSLGLVSETEALNPNPSDSLPIPYDDFQLVSYVTRLIVANSAAREIWKSEQRYRQLFECANDIVYTTDLTGLHYTSINQRGLDITGYSREDVTRFSFTEIASPEDVARGCEMLRRKLERGSLEPTIYEISIKTKDGSWLPIEINSQLIFEDGRPVGVQGIARDISARKANEAALVEANQRAIKEYRQLLRRISALAEMVGTARDVSTIFQGLVQFAHVSLPCDTMVLALYELEHNQVLPQFVWTPDGTNDISSSKPLVLNGGTPGQAVLSKKIVISNSKSQKFQSLNPSGSDTPPPNTIMTIPMMATERVVGLLEIHAESQEGFTEEHKTAISMAANIAAHGIENLRLLARDRDRENQLKQSQKMEALGRLAGGVAHDFNNILTAMFGYCDLGIADLENPNRPVDRQAVINYIESAKEVGARSKLFIEQLLGFSRKQVLKPRNLDLNKAIKEFTHVVTRLIGENINVCYTLDDSIPSVYLDPLQVQQIILNFAINSRDAMPSGGKISIETRVVYPTQPGYKPGATKDSNRPQVIMAFSDTGCGVDSETQKHIFEPFFTTKGQRGTGLGLAMVYGTVKQAGGATTVSSQVGKGTTFTIRFPGVRGTPEVEEFQPQGLFNNRKNSHTILVAEDDKLVQHTLSAALRAAGYDVCTADNGQQALEIFERDHEFIHMVVTDLLMPELSGTDLKSRIHRIKRHLPILYISGYPTDTITDDGVLPDDVAFLQKPFTHREILRKIDDMLHSSESSSSPSSVT